MYYSCMDDKPKSPLTWRPRPSTREGLERLREKTGRSRSELIDRAVSRYVREVERETHED